MPSLVGNMPTTSLQGNIAASPFTLAQQSSGLHAPAKVDISVLRLPVFPGTSAAKGLPSIDEGYWQDASASMEDTALQAAVADGVVTFVHAAAGMQDKLKQEPTPSTQHDATGIESLQQARGTGTQENLGPGGVQHVESIDDVGCLELE